MKWNPRIKSFFLQSADRAGLLAIAERRMAQAWTILTYHRVLDDDACSRYPFPSLAMPISAFERQVAWLAEHSRVLPLSQALYEYTSGGRQRRPLVTITFDDGYADNVHAAGVLERFEIRGTFYVTTGFVAAGEPLWFDRVAAAWPGVPSELRRACVRRLQCELPRTGQQFVTRLKSCSPSLRNELIECIESHSTFGDAAAIDCSPMTPEDVVDLHSRGHEIGSHTVGHPILPPLEHEALYAELYQSRTYLCDLLNDEVDSLAYPNGDCDDRVVREALACGYRFACTTVRGSNDDRLDPMRLRRIDVSGTPFTSLRQAGSDEHTERLQFRKALAIDGGWR